MHSEKTAVYTKVESQVFDNMVGWNIECWDQLTPTMNGIQEVLSVMRLVIDE